MSATITHETQATRRAIRLEDAAILACIGLLWLAHFSLTPPWSHLLMGVLLVSMVALFVRRKRRVDALFAELRQQQAAMAATGGRAFIPGVPGLPPTLRLVDEDPSKPDRPKVNVGANGRRED